MFTCGTRAGFALVEVLVSIILLGAAAAGLAAVLSGDVRMRARADAYVGAADHLRERLELLAALPCESGDSGTGSGAWGVERWQAEPDGAAWHLIDSLVPGRAPVVAIEARVACPQ